MKNINEIVKEINKMDGVNIKLNINENGDIEVIKTLTVEEVKNIVNKSNLYGICRHWNNDKVDIVENDDGSFTCCKCGRIFNIVSEFDKENLYNVIQTVLVYNNDLSNVEMRSISVLLNKESYTDEDIKLIERLFNKGIANVKKQEYQNMCYQPQPNNPYYGNGAIGNLTGGHRL